MSQNTTIEWTDATWSPLRVRVKKDAAQIAEAKGYTSLVQIAEKMAGRVGPHCEHVSPGCENCYAGTRNRRCLPANGTGLPYDRRSRDLVETFLGTRVFAEPLGWKKARKIFVENQSDLFGEWWSDDDILAVFQIIAKCPRHTFQILTKRQQRMRELLSTRRWRNLGHSPAMGGDAHVALIPGEHRTTDAAFLPNVWLGVSVEDDETARKRIPALLDTPAAVRFISYEPALGPVDLLDIGDGLSALTGWRMAPGVCEIPREHRRVDWVIAGGESGPRARPAHPQWFRDVRDQCVAAGVPFFFKQWGEWLPDQQNLSMTEEGRALATDSQAIRVGKKKAGRLLDGREWNEMP